MQNDVKTDKLIEFKNIYLIFLDCLKLKDKKMFDLLKDYLNLKKSVRTISFLAHCCHIYIQN